MTRMRVTVMLLLVLLVAPLLPGCAGPAVPTPTPTVPTGPRRDFVAVLNGGKVLPPTASRAAARASFHLSDDDSALLYRITARGLEGVTLVALRQGTSEMTGEPVAILYGDRKSVV